MKKLFTAFIFALLFQQHAYSYDLTITLTHAGDLINQVDVNTLDQVKKLTISGDINGTDILVIRKMENLKELDMANTNIVSGGVSYFDGYITANNIIGDYMFSDLSNLEHIKTPQNIIAINPLAFGGCVSLKEFTFTDKIRSISVSAFYNCKSISSISIPSNITSIRENAFYGCENLKAVTFADCTNSISLSKPFGQCPIETVYIGRSIDYNEFSGSPFAYLTRLKDITISDNVTILDFDFFRGCTGLETINLPNSIKEIRDAAFRECEMLKTIQLPNALTILYPYTFYGCSSLQKIAIPNSISVIGNNAFEGCKNLTSVNLPDSLISIADYAFYGCSLNLTSIKFPHYKTLDIGASVFRGCKTLTTLSIPSNIKSFGALAFADCENLREVIIEDGDNQIYFPVASISLGEGEDKDESSCFRNCPIEKIYIGRTIEEGTPFIDKKNLSSVSFANNIKKVPSFCGCVGLTSIILPNSVETIESQAFDGCENLSSIHLSDKIKLLPWKAFYGCKSLKEITIPSSVNALGGYAFRLCSNLTSITSLNPTPPSLTSYTFDEETEKNATLYVPTGSKNLYWLSRHWENFYNIVETDLSSINGIEIDKNEIINSVYSVDGRKLPTKDKSLLPKGVYIINGKKHLIK